ncbi:MAG: shikimate dehydrogenase [Beijerinckiaceae bacterium]|nr:MAG: shikimate dehydrogenase [Beijerinckiaceae bacterium]
MSTSSLAPHAFVIGWPIAHSRSPLIHNYWLKMLSLPGSYEQIAVRPEALTNFLGNFASEGFVGGNVTIPHKESAFALCAGTTPRAKLLRAVNTLWIDGGKLQGDNTDAAGFLASLDADAPGWDERCEKAVVIGAGGAARSIIAAIMSRSRCRMTLINRSRARGLELIELAHAIDPARAIELLDFSALPDCLAGADLLVNTTSLGMANQPPLNVDLTPLPDHAVVADIVYVPLETELLTAARSRGLRTSGGLGMLLHQAAPGFARWFGVAPEVTPELRALVARDIAGQS